MSVVEMSMPICCEKEMEPSMELGRFTEAKCRHCGDVVYVKKLSGDRAFLF